MDLTTLHNCVELLYEFFHGGELKNCISAQMTRSLALGDDYNEINIPNMEKVFAKATDPHSGNFLSSEVVSMVTY